MYYLPERAGRQGYSFSNRNKYIRSPPVPHPAFDLNGKVALITGGNGGIGLGFAEGLAMAGADIAIWGSNPAKNDAAVARLAQHGTRVAAYLCDVGDESATEATFAETLAHFGRIDGCFANAGVGGRGSPSFADISLEEWHRVTRVNIDGVFLTLRAAARHMAQRGGGGVLVGTASTAARMGAARNEHYGASKGAVVSMMRALAVEYARHGIRAHSILPGWVETEMTADAFANERFAANVKPRIPMRRWGRPDDFGGIAVYLMSDASGWHTGDDILIDGGYTLF
jgi:NAD(P)-dependent dehydrogenase (short-subunit alcohol dehydrogenase family)